MSKVIFITGPSGAGKSTTASQVAGSWPTTCALLDFDTIRTLVMSGYAEPAQGWNQQTEEQWVLAQEVVGAMTTTYRRHHVSVVVAAFATPPDYATWQSVLGSADLQMFVLLPSLHSAIERNNTRSGVAKLREADIRQNYESSQGWRGITGVTVLDNSIVSIEQVTQEIIRLVQAAKTK